MQVSNSSRRLLADSSADVTTQFDAGSTDAVTSVATDLTSAVSSGELLVSMTLSVIGLSIHVITMLSHETCLS